MKENIIDDGIEQMSNMLAEKIAVTTKLCGKDITTESSIIGALVLMFGSPVSKGKGIFEVRIPKILLAAVEGIIVDNKNDSIYVNINIGVPCLFRDGYGETARWIMKSGMVEVNHE